MSTAAIVALVWFVLLVLFVWGHKRWQDRMAAMDAVAEEALSEHNERQRLLQAAGRKYG
jgi:hypothetical protein